MQGLYNFKKAGAASEIQVDFKVQSAKLPGTNPARIDAGENNWRLLFADAVDQSCLWQSVLDDDYGGGALFLDIYFTMATATTGSVIFQASVMAVTPGDAADINVDSYDAPNSGTTTVPATAGHLKKLTIALTNKDTIAAGDYYKIRLNRDADNVNDTAAGDCECISVILRE